MTCDPLRARLGEYLEGDLDVADRARIDAHLAACPACRDDLSELRTLVSVLENLPEPDYPSGLADAAIARIEAREARLRPVRSAAGLLRRVADPSLAAALAAGLAAFALVTAETSPWGPAETGGLELAMSAAETPAGAALASRPLPSRPGAAAPARMSAGSSGGELVSFAGDRAPQTSPAPLRAASPDDRELDLLLRDPGAFLAKIEDLGNRERVVSRVAWRAARRGDAAQAASVLHDSGHPLGAPMAARFLAVSLAQSVERRDWTAASHIAPYPPAR